MEKKGKFVWMDGKFIPWDKASVHLMSNTVQHGMGIFEGIRLYIGEKGPSLFRLHDHTDRLFQSAKILNIKMPYTKNQLNDAQIEAARKSKTHSAYLRTMIYYDEEDFGPFAEGQKAHAMVAVWEMGALHPEKGLKLHTSSFTHIQVNSIMCKAKASGNYINPILSIQEAKAAGYDDALMLDTQGCVAEASSSNVFIVKNGVLYTPTDVSILPGITRHSVLSIAKDLNLECVVKNITRDEVYGADEMFLSGTATEIKPVINVDNRKIGKGSRGTITEKIQQSYHEIIYGLNPKYSAWLTQVN